MNQRTAVQPDKAVIPSLTSVSGGILQRKCACGQHTIAGGECDECRKKRVESSLAGATSLQRRSTNTAEPTAIPPIVYDVLRSPGQPLDSATRAFFEPRFGHDLSHVRVHTDSQAAESARAVNALAYTVGQHIAFSEGAYEPVAAGGGRLLSHELVHAIQQYGSQSPTQLVLANPKGSLEQQAGVISNDVMEAMPQHASSNRIQRMTSNGPLLAKADASAPPAGSPSATPKSIPHTVKVWMNSFIPDPMVKQPLFRTCLKGDGRSFSNLIHASYRSHQEIEFDTTTLASIDWADTGTSANLNCKTGAVEKTGKAPTSGLKNGPVTRSGGDVLVDFSASVSDPLLTIACAIDLKVQFHVNPATRQCSLSGKHDGFPAYEAYVTADGGAGVSVYTYGPTAAGEGPMALCGGLDKTVPSKSVTF